MDDKKKTAGILSKILSKTLVFILVVLFVVGFKSLFGEENTLIGVTTLILTLVFLPNDLTKRPVKNLLSIMSSNMALGVGTFIITQSIGLGFIINLVLVFLIGYTFSYELKKPLNMLVGLHYILMLTNPITVEQLPKRLLALACGGIIIMAAQMLVNKNKLVKSSKKMTKTIQEGLLTKIQCIKANKETQTVQAQIEEAICNFKLTIFHSETKQAQMSIYAKLLTNKVSCMEKLSMLLEHEEMMQLQPGVLKELAEHVEAIINNTEETSALEDLLNQYALSMPNNKSIEEFISTLIVLNTQKEAMKTLLEEKQETVEEEIDIAHEFENLPLFHKKADFASNRVAYGIRLGLLVSITTFIVARFNLQYGNWLIYTVFALTQPYKEFTQVKSKKRVFGTLVGAVILAILFSFITDPTMRAMTVVVAGYLMAYVSDYRNTVILITINSLATACINVPNANPVVLQRLIFVGMGIVVALIANKWILPRTYKDEEKKLEDLQREVADTLSKEILETDSLNEKRIQKLYLTQGLIENRINVMGLKVKDEIIAHYKKSINDMHQAYLLSTMIKEVA